MASLAPTELARLSEALVESAQRAAAWFSEPSPAAAAQAGTACARCAQASKRALAAIKARPAGTREPWLSACRALEEAGARCGRAVEEAARFDARAACFASMARQLAQAAEALCAAAGAAEPARCVEALVEAKKRALEVERSRRGVRKSALEDPRFVDGLKTQAVSDGLSAAAEAVHLAADALAEALAQEPA